MATRAPVARLAAAPPVGTTGVLPVVVGPTGVLEPVGAVWLPPAGGVTAVELEAAEVGEIGGGMTIPVTDVAATVVQGTVRVTVPLTTVVV